MNDMAKNVQEPPLTPDEPLAGSPEPALYINRELSWLEFNKRVLLESLDASVPLMERLKFLSIYASNLDEFFMVRVGSLSDQNLMEPNQLDDKTGMDAAGQIRSIIERVNEFVPLCEDAYAQIRRLMQQYGVDLLDFRKISKVEEAVAQKYFKDDIKPLLSPQIVDRHHPFPFLKNKEQYVATSFATKSGEVKLGIVPVSHLPQFFVFSIDDRQKVLFTADIVCHYAHELYTKYEIAQRLILRVTRNADISVDEGLLDYDVDFRGIMQELLKKRKRLSVVRVQTSHEPNDHLRKYLCQKLGVEASHFFPRNIPLDFSFGFSLPGQLKLPRKDLFFKERKPFAPIDFTGKTAIRYLSGNDLLLSYPFHSMKPFIDFLYEAADDPSVISIKISLYRLANHSRIASALAYAADRGKEVLCVLELRARFDEQSNIDYAKLLEDAGCTVIYGLSDYKIHAKLCLITRRVQNGIGYITQIGTGNYNEKTSELYTDLSLITADETVGQDAADVFRALCMGEVVESTRSLWVAPRRFLSCVLEGIDGEIAAQKAGGEGYVGIKANSLNDMELMQKLIEASQAGVKIELFIRGICCLRPGVPGYTDNITIRSIVGRLLEHSRIFIFGRGDAQKAFIGSGDLLNRNTRRRVEVFAPVVSKGVKGAVLHVFDTLRLDNVKAWEMQPDGSYVKYHSDGQPPLESHAALYDYFSQPIELAAPPLSVTNRIKKKLHEIWGGQ